MPAVARTARQIEADWDVKATQSAIDAVKGVISKEGINPRAAISSLSDLEFGWVVSAAIFAWIKTKAEQAVEEGSSYEETIRTMTARDPQPWEAGAIGTILPALGELGLDWSKPLGEWSKDQITSFAWQVYKLTGGALAKRDDGSNDKIVQRIGQSQTERELSASLGGPLMDRNELNDEVPF